MSTVDCWTEVYEKPYGCKIYLKGRLGEIHMPICVDTGNVYIVKPGVSIMNITNMFVTKGIEALTIFARLNQYQYDIDYKPLRRKVDQILKARFDAERYSLTSCMLRNSVRYTKEFAPGLIIAEKRWPFLFGNGVAARDSMGYRKMFQYDVFHNLGLLKLPRKTDPAVILKGTQFKDTKATWQALSGLMSGGVWAYVVKNMPKIDNYDDLLYIVRTIGENRNLRGIDNLPLILAELQSLMQHIDPKVLINRFRRHKIDRNWGDSMRMALTCIERGTPLSVVKDAMKTNDSYRMHQRFILLTNSRRGLDVLTFNNSETEYLNGTFNDYTFKVAESSETLDHAGYELWNCVAGYADRHNRHDCTIVIVSSAKKEFEAAIEVVIERINQAKIKYNHPVSEIPALDQAVIEWAEHHDLIPCYDMSNYDAWHAERKQNREYQFDDYGEVM